MSDEPEAMLENVVKSIRNGSIENVSDSPIQELQERARASQEAFEREEKMRKELEALNTKLLAEKTDLLRQLEGEAGSLQEYQERSIKLAAQKMDLESQLSVSTNLLFFHTKSPISIVDEKKEITFIKSNRRFLQISNSTAKTEVKLLCGR